MPLSSPPPPHHRATNDARETRILRDRYRALTRSIDRLTQSPKPYGAARQAVSIIDGGNMPTTGNNFFLGNPVLYVGTECEGCGDAGQVDATTIIPVLVLGTQAPAVGDQLTAYAVGGRWVADPIACCQQTQPTHQCGQCQIPLKTLQLSWVNYPNSAVICNPTSGTADMVWNGSVTDPSWQTAPITLTCEVGDDFFMFRLDCTGLSFTFLESPSGTIEGPYINECSTGPGAGPAGSFNVTSLTCSPFSFQLNNFLHNGFGPCGGFNAGGTGNPMTIGITDPDPGAPPAMTARRTDIEPPSPSALQIAANAVGAAGRVATALMKGESLFVTPEAESGRLATCGTCEHFSGTKCNLCGCLVKAKASLKSESCPAGKW